MSPILPMRMIFLTLTIHLLLLSIIPFASAALPPTDLHIPSTFNPSIFEIGTHITRTTPQNRAARHQIAIQRPSKPQNQFPISRHVDSVAAEDKIENMRKEGEKTLITTKTRTRTTHMPEATAAMILNPKHCALVQEIGVVQKQAKVLSKQAEKISSTAKNLLILQKEVNDKMALHTSVMNHCLGDLDTLIRDIQATVNKPGLKSQLAAMSDLLPHYEAHASPAGSADAQKPDPTIVQTIARLMQLLLSNAESMICLEGKIMKILRIVETINHEIVSFNKYLVEVEPEIQILIESLAT